MTDIIPSEIEKTCLRRIEVAMNYEKDPDIRKGIESVGRDICKYMSERSTNHLVIHRVMNAAIRALPVYTVARPEKVKLRD